MRANVFGNQSDKLWIFNFSKEVNGDLKRPGSHIELNSNLRLFKVPKTYIRVGA